MTAASKAKQLGLTPLATHQGLRIGSGVDPVHHGHGPVSGRRRRCLAEGRLESHEDLDLMEINEAFAAQAVCRQQGNGLGHQQDQRQRWRDRAGPSDRRIGLRACWSRCCMKWAGAMRRKGLASAYASAAAWVWHSRWSATDS